MNVIIKNKKQIEAITEGGKILAFVMNEVLKKVKPGVTSLELNDFAHELIIKKGGKPAFLNYKPHGAKKGYPFSICSSLNNEIVHGLSTNIPLKEGDIISIDIGLNYKGYFTDHAKTVGVGKISKKDENLIRDTNKALLIGIEQAVVGNTVGDIGHAIEKFAKNKYGIVRELSGHGVGVKIHEDPYVPNFGKKGKGHKLLPGMIIAIEPMLNNGRASIITASDGWTIKTEDGSRSAHFEHTVLISEEGPKILTSIN